MKPGMAGPGRMGANMAERLRRGGHEVAGYDRDPAVPAILQPGQNDRDTRVQVSCADEAASPS